MHRFRCCVGHEWQRRSRDALVNLLCPRCMSHALALKRMDSLRRLYEAVAGWGGLLLLENVYFGLVWHYRFVCRQGHEWRTNARNVLNGSWCPQCARLRRGRLMRSNGLDDLAARSSSPALDAVHRALPAET
ncbi:hypothetical protein GHU06_29320 [Pseudomonas aeruginosa]|uniref:Zinc-ribbon domain-containing protein n=1 Tax=Pseudomonas aeruginosa TaxID=287 RepID=A0A6A9K6W7_PSEAI|nr:hypothetical protein [Pseudomonas aeruginosa]MBF8801491.1 hypothetical protein [Pseudomonas aeruginosa]MBG6715793.1 hypothetical protein [Pseudomonas aeruginosa]MBG7428849.1 hypothetical protein [Pseudomonas aeruginosa]MCO1672973.1 hypothetical protein [Pseudomonas aeruginosa]MCO1771467.1 hypothetical protein [Pseudomonas aeruginosa]